MLDFSFPAILKLFEKYQDNNRNNSAAFLIWYLENYYRLDPIDAIDSVCDQKGDKGIDGIYINHSEGTIHVFQTKLSEKPGRTLGDTHLKEFIGTLEQLNSSETLKILMEAENTNIELKRLVDRIELKKFIDEYTVYGIFISNMELDNNGLTYLSVAKNLKVIGPKELQSDYILDSHTLTNRESIFSLSEAEYLKYSVDSNLYTIVAPIKANELVKIDGIKNQSVFLYNVRGHLGNTAVNKGISKTIEDSEKHSKFPLFHNGITIVCESISIESDKNIRIKNFFVVNGCQSLSTLYKKAKSITENLKILVKFIQVGNSDSTLTQEITNFSNNQNGIKARDFKSNHPTQIRLKNDIEKNFPDYIFEIKRGGENTNRKVVISNEELGMWLMSFDKKEPWDTHRKYQIFDEKYNELFTGPNLNSYRVIFLHQISSIIDEVLNSEEHMENQLVAKYILTKYAVFYILREILESDTKGKELILNPSEFISDKNIEILSKIIKEIVIDIVIDFKYEIQDLGENFDYRAKLRDKAWIQELRKNITASNMKEIAKGKALSFTERWQKETSKSL